jgi:glycosyltransferase involved in cell wall biosynthesis
VTRKRRVLFVSRERFRLPLSGSQKRKWDALRDVFDVRVLAAATPGLATGDDEFHLVPPVRPRLLDGALYYLLLPWRIARELRAFRPDAALVQGTHETTAFLIARFATRGQTKVILDVQGDWHDATRRYGSRLRRVLNPLSDAIAPLAVRSADEVRVVSTHTAELVRAAGREPAASFPSYVDAAIFARRPRAPLPSTPRALYVGVLESVKAFDSLVEAWRLAAPQVPGAVLQIVGDGTMRDEASRLLADLPAQTEWQRRLEPDGVAQAMDESWVVCLPSRSEGLPRVAVEAACRGRAIIGGNRAGIPDVVRHDENGLLVDPDDVAGLAAALVSLLSDRAAAERLGAAARRTGDEWSVEPHEYAERVVDLVERAMSG